MTRTKTEIIKELNDCDNLYHRLVMDIGQGYADYIRTNDERLTTIINDRIVVLTKVELQKIKLETELKESAE